MAGPISGEIISPELFKGEQDERSRDIFAQQHFNYLTENLEHLELHALPDITLALDHNGVRSVGIEPVMAGSQNRAFLGEKLIGLIESHGVPTDLEFENQPLLRIGKENSFHKPFFGRLNASWLSDSPNSKIQVAVKPIPERSLGRQRLIHEAAMYKYVKQLEIPTIDVMGILLFDTPKSGISGYVISEFDPDLVTLDTLRWDKMTIGEQFGQVDAVLDTLSILHSELVFHGDTEFKNIAIGESEDTIKVIDLEWAVSLRDAANNIRKLTQQMSSDFTQTSKSIGEFIFSKSDEFKKLDDLERYHLLRDKVYLPYLERIVRINSPHVEVLIQAYDIVIAEKLAQANGDW